MSSVVPIEPRRVLREAIRWLHTKSTVRRGPLISMRLSRWSSGLDRDYRVILGTDLVLRVSDPSTGGVLAQADLFDAVALLDRGQRQHLE